MNEPSISEIEWEKIEPLLPAPQPKKKMGRPRMSDRQAMAAIWWKFHTGCSWKSLPRSLGAASTIYDRFRTWQAAGVFDQLVRAGLLQENLEGMKS